MKNVTTQTKKLINNGLVVGLVLALLGYSANGIISQIKYNHRIEVLEQNTEELKETKVDNNVWSSALDQNKSEHTLIYNAIIQTNSDLKANNDKLEETNKILYKLLGRSEEYGLQYKSNSIKSSIDSINRLYQVNRY